MKPFASFVCVSCRRAGLSQAVKRSILPPSRTFSTTPKPLAGSSSDDIMKTFQYVSDSQKGNSPVISTQQGQRRSSGLNLSAMLDGPPETQGPLYLIPQITPKHRLHVYATKHNTHLTLTAPVPRKDTGGDSASNAFKAPEPNNIVMSFATGNIGFRKAGRGSYDAAYQLTAFIMKQIQERGLLRSIHQMEVVLRGFGAGRDAVTKALLGAEGRLVRNKITAVVDATRLKFGGPRSPKPRRLG